MATVHEAGAARSTPEEVAERRSEARRLRTAGLTYKEIGDRLGVSHVSAINYLEGAPPFPSITITITPAGCKIEAPGIDGRVLASRVGTALRRRGDTVAFKEER